MDEPTPDWTRKCTVDDLDDLAGQPYMLRVSGEADSPWRSVKTRTQGMWIDAETDTRFDYITVKFHDDDRERMLDKADEIEVGLIRPPWWSEGMEPPEWPRPRR